jgi:hypothetical protein
MTVNSFLSWLGFKKFDEVWNNKLLYPLRCDTGERVSAYLFIESFKLACFSEICILRISGSHWTNLFFGIIYLYACVYAILCPASLVVFFHFISCYFRGDFLYTYVLVWLLLLVTNANPFDCLCSLVDINKNFNFNFY